jgi:hypothetical protein
MEHLFTPKSTGSGEGGVSGIITGDDSDLNSSVGNWVAYADAAGVNPVDGTGGSPVITVTRTTSSPLHGAGSLLITKDAANRQGEGGSLTKTVDPKFRAQPVQFSFSYEGSANFDYGAADVSDPSDIIVQLYDVTNSVLLNPNPGYLNGSGYFAGLVQIPSTCTSIRAILHIATTNANAWTFKVDDFQLDLVGNPTVNSGSDWITYTPTFTGFGTAASVDVRYRKDGPDLVIEGTFTTGTVTATEARISLPAGLTASSSLPTLSEAGQLLKTANAATSFHWTTLKEPSVAYITFGYQSSTTGSLTKTLGNVGFGNTQAVAFNARVPIQGWTSGYAHPGQIGLNPNVILMGYKSSGNITANTTIAGWDAPQIDTTDSWNETTGVYTVKSPGSYQVSFAVDSAAGAGTRTNVMLNGVNVYGFDPIATAGTGITCQMPPVILPNLKYGDLITFELNANLTLAATDIKNWVNIIKIGGAQQPYITRYCTIKDVKAANTAGGTATSGSWETRTLNTLEGDQSFVTLASNQFTLQPGTYRIRASAPAQTVNRHKIKLRRITATAADIILGTSAYSNATAPSPTISELAGTFSISTAVAFEIQHQVETTKATNGYGVESNLGVSEVYTVVELEKVL